MTTSALTDTQLKAIFGTAIGTTEGAGATYVLSNPYGSFVNLTMKAASSNPLLSGQTFDQIVREADWVRGGTETPTPIGQAALNALNKADITWGQSGYSFGFIQTDLGAQGNDQATAHGITDGLPRETLASYLARHIVADTGLNMSADDLAAGLTWNLGAFRDTDKNDADVTRNFWDGPRPPLTDAQFAKVNAWFSSPSGIAMVDKLDTKASELTVDAVKPTLDMLASRPGWSNDDLVAAAAYLMKTYNQSHVYFNDMAGYLEATPDATISSLQVWVNNPAHIKGYRTLASDKAMSFAPALEALSDSSDFQGLWSDIQSLTQNMSQEVRQNPDVTTLLTVMTGGASAQFGEAIKAVDDQNVSGLLFLTQGMDWPSATLRIVRYIFRPDRVPIRF